MSLWGTALTGTPKFFFFSYMPPQWRCLVSSRLFCPIPWTRLNWYLGWDPAWEVEYSISKVIPYGQCNIFMASQARCLVLSHPPWTGLNGYLGWDLHRRLNTVSLMQSPVANVIYLWHLRQDILSHPILLSPLWTRLNGPLGWDLVRTLNILLWHNLLWPM